MRKILVCLTILLLLNCDLNESTGTNDVKILDIDFSEAIKTITNTSLEASFVATNNSGNTIPSDWRVEGQFYHETDSGITFILGGDYEKFTHSLPNTTSESIQLIISGSNGFFNGHYINSIDDFYVSDIRAIKD